MHLVLSLMSCFRPVFCPSSHVFATMVASIVHPHHPPSPTHTSYTTPMISPTHPPPTIERRVSSFADYLGSAQKQPKPSIFRRLSASLSSSSSTPAIKNGHPNTEPTPKTFSSPAQSKPSWVTTAPSVNSDRRPVVHAANASGASEPRTGRDEIASIAGPGSASAAFPPTTNASTDLGPRRMSVRRPLVHLDAHSDEEGSIPFGASITPQSASPALAAVGAVGSPSSPPPTTTATGVATGRHRSSISSPTRPTKTTSSLDIKPNLSSEPSNRRHSFLNTFSFSSSRGLPSPPLSSSTTNPHQIIPAAAAAAPSSPPPIMTQFPPRPTRKLSQRDRFNHAGGNSACQIPIPAERRGSTYGAPSTATLTPEEIAAAAEVRRENHRIKQKERQERERIEALLEAQARAARRRGDSETKLPLLTRRATNEAEEEEQKEREYQERVAGWMDKERRRPSGMLPDHTVDKGPSSFALGPVMD